MSDQLELAWEGALEGMQRAARHAEDDAPGWQLRAARWLRAYIAAHPGQDFIAPAVRAWAELQGLDKPPTNYAWGNVFRCASMAGLIVAAGYRQHGDAVMHLQSVRAWRAA